MTFLSQEKHETRQETFQQGQEDRKERIARALLFLLDITICAVIFAAGACRFGFYVSTSRADIVASVPLGCSRTNAGSTTGTTSFTDLGGSLWYSDFGHFCDGCFAVLLPVKLMTKINALPKCQNTKLFIQVFQNVVVNGSIVFFLYGATLFTYGCLGHYLFSPYLDEYQNIQMSVMTLVLTSIGQFDYSAYENVQPFVAFCYFFSFIILAVFIVVKFFTSVVNHEYSKLAVAARPDDD